MSLTFWAGIIIGAVLSLIASFLANLYTDQVRSFLSQRRQLRLSSKKRNELKTHSYVSALKNGQPAAMLHFSYKRDTSVRFLLYSIAALISLCTIVLLPDELRMRSPTSARIIGIAQAFISTIALIVSFANVASVRSTLNKVIHFKIYEQRIRDKWGDDAV
jgi:hypothetical protein